MIDTPKIYTLQFWLLCASSFLFFCSFNMLIPELPQYITELGGAEYKGLIIPMFALAAMISRPLSGKLADNIGRIPVMIVGVLVCFVIGFVYPLWQTLFGFLFLRFMHGFSAGFKPTGTAAYLADIVPIERRGEAMGMIGMFGSLGMSVGPAVGPIIAENFSLQTLFHSSSIVAILSIAVIIGMKETVADKKKMSASLLRIGKADYFEPNVFTPALVMTLTVISFGAILTVIPDFSDHLGMSREQRGLFFTVFTVASIAVRFAAGKASDKYGRANLVKFSTFALALSMLLLGFVSTVPQFLGVAVLFGLAVGVNSPTLFAWTVDLANEKFRGRAMATLFIALEIGIIVGGLLSGWLYGNDSGNFMRTFVGCGLFSLLAFIYLILIEPRYAKK